MATVKVCLWNIQNFGGGNVARRWGANSDLRNWFIMNFVRHQAIDVLMVMEMTEAGSSSLKDLMRTLVSGPKTNEDWACSYCGAAVTKRSPNPPVNSDQLTFQTDARNEGYAVAWRTNQATRFTVVPAVHDLSSNTYYHTGKAYPGEVLNLTTVGRPAGSVKYESIGAKGRRTTRESWEALGGYTTGQSFPYDDKGKVMTSWPKLEFSATGKYSGTLRWDRTRRPAYVVLDLATGAGSARDRLCPIGVYHAPSKASRAEWGALQAGLSRELYVTNDLAAGKPDVTTYINPKRVVLGGDFNYSVDSAEWPNYYTYFVENFGKAGTSGANCAEAPLHTASDDDRRTAVRLLKGEEHDEVIDGDEINDYLSHKIDLVFFRGAGVTGTRVNIPQVLIDTPDNYKATLKKFYTHLTKLVAGLGPDQQLNDEDHGPEELRDKGTSDERWVSMLPGAWGAKFESWDEFMDQLKKGKLTGARQAAEFYSIFVSDHLPLVATITF